MSPVVMSECTMPTAASSNHGAQTQKSVEVAFASKGIINDGILRISVAHVIETVGGGRSFVVVKARVVLRSRLRPRS